MTQLIQTYSVFALVMAVDVGVKYPMRVSRYVPCGRRVIIRTKEDVSTT